MRKNLVFIMCILVLISFCACNVNPNVPDTDELIDKESYLSAIYENDHELAKSENNFNHTNMIPEREFFVDSSVQSEKKYMANGVELNLIYHDTINDPVGPKRINRYLVEGSDDEMILFSSNGSICSTSFDISTIEISPQDTPEEVLPLLSEALSEYVNLEKYKEVDMPEVPKNIANGFGSYTFTFYNLINGCRTDYMVVNVYSNGGITFRIYDLQYDGEISINIDKDMEDKLINLKLNDIYTVGKYKYDSYNMTFMPQVCVYENEIYLTYYVAAMYMTEDGGRRVSWINTILIPAELINSK